MTRGHSGGVEDWVWETRLFTAASHLFPSLSMDWGVAGSEGG